MNTTTPQQPAPDTAVVLSASRRTDLVACFPDYFITRLKEFPPHNVHSIVIWTKNPANLLGLEELRSCLSKYSQLYIHLSITGMGATIFEPNIPPWQEVADMVPGLVRLVGDPGRISWRFDPILFAQVAGKRYTNFSLFAPIAEAVKRSGVTSCRTSWVEAYKKVQRRVAKKNITLEIQPYEQRLAQAGELRKIAEKTGMSVAYCSMEGFPRSRCIDGKLLIELHPEKALCSQRKAKGQRKLCGCTESLDIGWYSQKCRNGCIYCYAEPLVE